MPLLNCPVPICVVPLKKFTAPVGAPLVDVTLAVKTTGLDEPTVTNVGARLNVVVVGTLRVPAREQVRDVDGAEAGGLVVAA